MSTQATAARKFLPFCRALLLGNSPPRTQGRLPLRRPNALTAEVILALEDMINKATMGWLIRGIGWRRMQIPDGDDIFEARIWDEAIWGDLRLKFTAVSIDLLLMTWNLLCESASSTPVHPSNRRWRKMSPKQRVMWQANARKQAASAQERQNQERMAHLPIAASGDLLLHHIVFRSLYRRRAIYPDLWMNNPLNLMAFYTQAGLRSPEQCGALQKLLTGPLAPLMPWLSTEWPVLWRGLPGPESLEGLGRQHFNQAMVFAAWVQACEQTDQEHLLVPLIQGFVDQLSRLPADQKRLAIYTSGLPLTSRQPAHRQWADAFEPLHAIYLRHQTALRTHPIDREGSARILLSEAARLHLPAVYRQTQAAAHQLNDSIG